MTLTTFSSGVNTSFSTQLNANFKNAYSRVVASTPYTGTGFNAARSGSGGTTTNNTTLTVAANLIYDYVRIVITVSGTATHSTTGIDGHSDIKIETSVASAASWTTRFDNQIFVATGNSSGTQTNGGIRTIEFYYAPTASEKSTGLDIRITGSAVTQSTGAADIANVQTMVFAN